MPRNSPRIYGSTQFTLALGVDPPDYVLADEKHLTLNGDKASRRAGCSA
jgi:hypothetical protein